MGGKSMNVGAQGPEGTAMPVRRLHIDASLLRETDQAELRAQRIDPPVAIHRDIAQGVLESQGFARHLDGGCKGSGLSVIDLDRRRASARRAEPRRA
jgi:hypothetical protein